MALLTARLLFVERDGDVVRLDVVVIERAETPSSPAVGEPLCFAFALPGDGPCRDAAESVLQAWAEGMRIVSMDVSTHRGQTVVRLAAGQASMALAPAAC